MGFAYSCRGGPARAPFMGTRIISRCHEFWPCTRHRRTSSGLGREMVRRLVQDRGVTVLATARRLDRLEQLAAELPPGRVHVLAGNLIDTGFREQLWRRAVDLPGGLDLLINNAGAGNYAEFADQDPHAIRRIIALNVMALMDLSQKASRYMRARHSGQILQISSFLGFVGIPYSAAMSQASMP